MDLPNTSIWRSMNVLEKPFLAVRPENETRGTFSAHRNVEDIGRSNYC